MRQPLPLLCLFFFFWNTNFTEKNCRFQRDSNSDRQSWSRACKPLDHHHGPFYHLFTATCSVINVSTWSKNLIIKTVLYLVNNWHHGLQFPRCEDRWQNVSHHLPLIALQDCQHVHEVLVRFPADANLTAINKVIKILDHDVFCQLQITDNKLHSTEWTVCANDLIIRVLLVDMICTVCEGHFSHQHLPSSLSSKWEVPWDQKYKTFLVNLVATKNSRNILLHDKINFLLSLNLYSLGSKREN